MGKSENQKQKLLIVLQLLWEKSDEDHWLTCNDILAELERQGIAAERKSIYSDIAALQDYGIDIECRRGAGGGYFIANRDFELPELKLLVDAVQFCRFITPSKSEKLIKKLQGLSSQYQAASLGGNLWLDNKGKAVNESILLNIDSLRDALSRRVLVSFQYYKWHIDFSGAERFVSIPMNEGRAYKVQPLGLIWDDENYYLVAEETESREIRHFRLDRMKNIHCLEEKAEGNSALNINEYAAGHFNMMGGTACRIRLRVHNELTSVLLDKYGKDDIFPMPYGENQFECSVDAVVSEQFFGWLAGFGGKMQLVGPEELCREYHSYLAGMLERYEIEVMK